MQKVFSCVILECFDCFADEKQSVFFISKFLTIEQEKDLKVFKIQAKSFFDNKCFH